MDTKSLPKDAVQLYEVCRKLLFEFYDVSKGHKELDEELRKTFKYLQKSHTSSQTGSKPISDKSIPKTVKGAVQGSNERYRNGGKYDYLKGCVC